MKQHEMWESEIDEFVIAKERYGTWPTTVWVVDCSDQKTKKLKQLIGDADSSRHAAVQGTFGYQRGASVFSPAVCSWVLNMYAPAGGVCFDPFAGGGTRAIMAAKHGLRYVGMEIREEECREIEKRAMALGVEKAVTIHCGDSRACGKVRDSAADFLFTCPPYWNLEKYNGGQNDLSMIADYNVFQAGIAKVIQEAKRILRPGAISVWVVGLHRCATGFLLPLHHHIAKSHIDAGFHFLEEIVLHTTNNGSLQRVGSFEKGSKKLIRVHEYALIFRAPSP